MAEITIAKYEDVTELRDKPQISKARAKAVSGKLTFTSIDSFGRTSNLGDEIFISFVEDSNLTDKSFVLNGTNCTIDSDLFPLSVSEDDVITLRCDGTSGKTWIISDESVYTKLNSKITTLNSEVVDARTGAGGQSYNSLGAAIRGQFNTMGENFESEINDLKGDISRNTYEIENLYAMAKGELYREQVDETVAQSKSVPIDTCPNAILKMVGGMSIKVDGIEELIDAKVDEIEFKGCYEYLLTVYQKNWLINNQNTWYKLTTTVFYHNSKKSIYVMTGNLTDSTLIEISQTSVTNRNNSWFWGSNQTNINNWYKGNGDTNYLYINHDEKLINPTATINIPAIATKEIPQSIQSLDGYGIGINNTCYNYLENVGDKWYYHKTIDSIDLGTLSWSESSSISHFFIASLYNAYTGNNLGNKENILCAKYDTKSYNNIVNLNEGICLFQGNGGNKIGIYDNTKTLESLADYLNGVKLIYKLNNEVVTDITSLIPDNFDILKVESNGKISFHYPKLDDGYMIDVPNKELYLIKLGGN